MEILLKKHELLDLGRNLAGNKLVCCSGSCWLTQAGDSRDFILQDGAEFDVRMSGKIIISATEDCRLLLVAKSSQFASMPRQLLASGR